MILLLSLLIVAVVNSFCEDDEDALRLSALCLFFVAVVNGTLLDRFNDISTIVVIIIVAAASTIIIIIIIIITSTIISIVIMHWIRYIDIIIIFIIVIVAVSFLFAFPLIIYL